jgi:hypothetical protein
MQFANGARLYDFLTEILSIQRPEQNIRSGRFWFKFQAAPLDYPTDTLFLTDSE